MNTVIACLTPPEAGAIATLGIHGPRALEVLRGLFRPAVAEEHPGAHSLWLGKLGAELADEVVVTVPQLTPVPLVEAHCHGGREVVRLLLDAFAAQGVQEIDWRAWLTRTAPTAVAAEIQIALANAPTPRTAAILLEQLDGRLERALASAEGRAELSRWANFGMHLTQPWRVVIAGAPNTGKSSLVNAIAGYQRCVVSPTPGTTRDVVTTAIALDGWPVELLDTAGLRLAEGAIEEEGIRRALDAIGTADLCVWLLDGATTPVYPGPEWSDVLKVVNKVDQPPAWDWGDAPRVSATTGVGVAELCQAIAARLVPEVPPPGTAIPVCPGQLNR